MTYDTNKMIVIASDNDGCFVLRGTNLNQTIVWENVSPVATDIFVDITSDPNKPSRHILIGYNRIWMCDDIWASPVMWRQVYNLTNSDQMVGNIRGTSAKSGFFCWICDRKVDQLTTDMYFGYTADYFNSVSYVRVAQLVNASSSGSYGPFTTSLELGHFNTSTKSDIWISPACTSHGSIDSGIWHSADWGLHWSFVYVAQAGAVLAMPNALPDGSNNVNNINLMHWDENGFFIESTLKSDLHKLYNNDGFSAYFSNYLVSPYDNNSNDIILTDGYSVYASSTNGTTWSTVFTWNAVLNGPHGGIFRSSTDPNTFITWRQDGLRVTSDKGATWSDLYQGLAQFVHNGASQSITVIVAKYPLSVSTQTSVPLNSGAPFCLLCWIGEVISRFPIGLHSGEKMEEVTDLSIPSVSDALTFTRNYRQSKQSLYQFMGLGWTHNFMLSLATVANTPVPTLLLQMPNGGELYFTQSSTDSSLYLAAPGSSAIIRVSGTQYILTALDKSTYTFQNGQVIRRVWPTSDFWIYNYVGSQLSSIVDTYNHSINFVYKPINTPAHFDDGQLWRVGDTGSGLGGSNPSGRYVEFGYSPERQNGIVISNPHALLTRIRDVRGNTSTYEYYGQTAGENDGTQFNYLTSQFSSQVDSTGNGNAGTPLLFKYLNYTTVSGKVSAITQYNGLQAAELAIDGDMETFPIQTWLSIGGAALTANNYSTGASVSGQASRYVAINAPGQGIEGNPINLVANRLYRLTAWVYPVLGTTVTLRLSTDTTVSRSSIGNNAWELIQFTYKPTMNVSASKLQLVANSSTASFYADSVSIAEFDLGQAGVRAQNGTTSLVTNWKFQDGSKNTTTETTAGKITSHMFADDGTYVGTKDPAGNSPTQQLNAQYRPSQQKDAKGNTTNLTWSADGSSLNKVSDPLGNSTQFQYNAGGAADGTLSSSIDAQGRVTRYAYTDVANPRQPTDIKVFDTDGITLLQWQQFTYDHGRILRELHLDPRDATGQTVQSETDRTYYASGNGNGLLQSVTQKDLLTPANTTTTTYFYDSVGRVVRTNQSATFGSCLSSYTVYDPAGNVVASLCNYDPNGQVDPTTAAAAVSIYQIAYPGNPDKNRVTTSVYDTLGRRVRTTTDAGAPYAQTSLTVYDGLNRVIRTIGNYVPVLGINDPYLHSRADFTHGQNNDQNLITETTYNERGFAKSQLDTLGNVTLYGYDDGGRLVTSVQNASQPAYDNSSLGSDPALSRYATLIVNNRLDQDVVTRYQYDSVGNLIRATDVLGNVSLTGYDALNRPINTVQNASQPTYNLNVDPALAYYMPTPATDQDMTSYTEYDALGRVRRTQDTLGTWTLYAYDSLGRQTATVSSASYPTYDASHDPTFSNYPLSTAADQDVLSLTTYDSFGRVLYTTDVLGRKTWYAYDGLGRAVQTIANAVGTATDNGPRDPRSPLYAASTDSDKDLISTTTYDSNGYVMWSQDSLGRKTWYAYDNVGRQIRTITNASGTATDNGSRDPRSSFYVPSSAPDQDLISQTVYNAQGRVVAAIDSLGNQTQYVYDSLGRRLKTISNFVTGVYNPLRPDQDLITTTTYDLAGRVVATVDSRGTRTAFTYDSLGRRVTATQAAGTSLATTSYTCYDKAGRVLRVIQNWRPSATDAPPDALDSQGNWLFNPTSYGLANDQNRITSYTLDLAGRQLSTTGAYSLTLSGLQQLTNHAVYYKDGQVDHVTDASNATTTYGYDKLRRRNLVVQGYLDAINQWGNPTTWSWNATANQWQSSTGTSIGFNGPYASNDRLRHPNSNNLIVQLSYDRAGRLLNQRDPNGNLTTYAYDLLNRRTTLTDPLSNTWLTSYARLPNGQTNLISTDANNHQTQQTFDRAGRLTTLQYLNEPSAITPNVSFDYNKLGSRLAMHETLGTSSVRNTTYAFDQARRLTAVNLDVRGDGSTIQTVSYQYDAGGLRTQLTMPDGKTVSYTYDARGQLVGLSDWNAQAVRYDYDNAGRLSAVERPNGLRSGYQYDAGSRLTQLRHTAASKTLAQFDYVPGTRGNRIQIREATRSATTGSTVLTSTDPSIGYPQGTWNPINNFSVSTDVSAALHVAFMGNQLTLQLGQGPDHGLCDLYIDDALYQTFDGYAATATDVPLSLTIGLSNDGPHTLDIRNRAERNTRASAFKVRFFSLTLPIKYDLHTMYFNRTSVINGTTTITTDGYDTASRLYFVDYFPGDNLKATPYLSYDYNYDLAGNRLAQTVTQPASVPAKVASTFTYNAANRLLTSSLQNQDINGNPIGSPTSTSYQYDNNGNQVNINNAVTPVYQWDRANRLQTYTDPTTTLHYTYNGMGQRLHQDGQKIVNGITGTSTTDYVLDTQPGLWKVLQTTTGSTSVTSYVHGPTGLQQQYNPSVPAAPLWMVPDGLGSVRSVADNTAMPQETRFYDPYGTPTQTSGTSQTVFGFTGEETDANGLVNLRARSYNPIIGQFMGLDSLEGIASSPMSLNRYAYVQDNPINFTDPTGNYWWGETGIPNIDLLANPLDYMSNLIQLQRAEWGSDPNHWHAEYYIDAKGGNRDLNQPVDLIFTSDPDRKIQLWEIKPNSATQRNQGRTQRNDNINAANSRSSSGVFSKNGRPYPNGGQFNYDWTGYTWVAGTDFPQEVIIGIVEGKGPPYEVWSAGQIEPGLIVYWKETVDDPPILLIPAAAQKSKIPRDKADQYNVSVPPNITLLPKISGNAQKGGQKAAFSPAVGAIAVVSVGCLGALAIFGVPDEPAIAAILLLVFG